MEQNTDSESPSLCVPWQDEDALCAIVEMLIFMSDRPLPLNKIHRHIGEEMPREALERVICQLQEKYRERHHGISLVKVGGGFQFRTKEDYAQYIQGFFKVNSIVLSPTAMEVLAIIAYRGAIAKSEVDKIRGVDSSYIIRGLMDKGLVKVAGRSEGLGRSVLYETTPRFLEMFNLADLSELPPEHELEEISGEKVGKISDIKTLTDSSNAFYYDEWEELDELQEEIKKISTDTEFTKALKFERKTQSTTPSKSAFDILAEHISMKEISRMNQSSSQSHPISYGQILEDDPLKKSSLEFDQKELSSEEEELLKQEENLDKLTGKIIDNAHKLDIKIGLAKDEP